MPEGVRRGHFCPLTRTFTDRWCDRPYPPVSSPERPAEDADPGEWYRYLEALVAEERHRRERLTVELRGRDALLNERIDGVTRTQVEQGERLAVLWLTQVGEDELAGAFWALWLILVGALLQAAAAAFG